MRTIRLLNSIRSGKDIIHANSVLDVPVDALAVELVGADAAEFDEADETVERSPHSPLHLYDEILPALPPVAERPLP